MISYMIKITKSLTELTKRNIKWQWNRKHEKVFRKIRQLITKEQILEHFDLTKELIIETNTSDYTTKEVLI